MKTKNFLVLAVIICGMFNVVNVAAQATNTDNVTLKIKLQPIQTITVNPAQNNVEIVYANVDDYNNGVSVVQEDHLSVFSTGGFEVSVKSKSDVFERTDGPETLPIGDMSVQVSPGSKTNSTENYHPVVLNSTDFQNVIESSKGGRNLTYSVTYDNSLGGNDAYIDMFKKYATSNNEFAEFTAEITYTIIAK